MNTKQCPYCHKTLPEEVLDVQQFFQAPPGDKPPIIRDYEASLVLAQQVLRGMSKKKKH